MAPRFGRAVRLPVVAVAVTALLGAAVVGLPATPAARAATATATTTTLAVSPTGSPLPGGSSATLTATVTPTTATGTVMFTDLWPSGDPVTVGTATVVAGRAVLSLTRPRPGTHVLRALFTPADGSWAPSSSTLQSGVVTWSSTLTTLSVTPPGPVGYAQPVVLSATVSVPGLGADTSALEGVEVDFYDGGTFVDRAHVSQGAATLSTAAWTTPPTSGLHQYTAHAQGSAWTLPSDSGAVALTVGAATSLVLSTTPSCPVRPGASVLVTVRVTPATAAGTVRFSVDGTVAGTPLPVVGGSASTTLSLPAVRSYVLSGAFVPTDPVSFSPSTASVTCGVTAAPAATTLALAAAPAAGATTTQSVTVTATVTPPSATGSVQFSDGGTPLGGPVAVVGGIATLPARLLALGSHPLAATFAAADPTAYTGSVAPVLTYQVGSTPTTLGLAVTPQPTSVFGSPVHLTASVQPPAATGSVDLYDGADKVGTATLAAGTATWATTTLAVGPHALSARYVPPAGSAYAGSVAPTQSTTVTPAPSTTGLTPSSTTVLRGQPLTLRAVVTGSVAGGPRPTGTVTFTDGGLVLGARDVATDGGASFTTDTLSPGTHTMSATYQPGDGSAYSGSASGSVAVVVSVVVTTTVLTEAPAPQVGYGTPVVLTATVLPSTASGTITFVDGGTTVGAAAVTGGTAGVSLPGLPLGLHTFRATFAPSGGSAFLASASGTVTVVVVSSTTLAVAPPSPVPLGTPLTMTATVRPPQATGTVSFRDGATAVATASVVGGTATATLGGLAVGSHSLTAVFVPADGSPSGSTSPALAYSVTKVATFTALQVSPAGAAPVGRPVLLAVVVAPATAPGTVQLFDGTVPLGPVQRVTAGTSQYQTTALGVGVHQLSAAFTPDDPGTYTGSSSPVAPLTVGATPDPLTGCPAQPSSAGGAAASLACVQTRLSDSSPPPTPPSAPPTLGVRVGSRVERLPWSALAPAGCRAFVWLVVLRGTDGASAWSVAGTGGLLAPLCVPGALAAVVAQVTALGPSVTVVVNTATAGPSACGTFVYPTLGDDLGPLGFGDTAALDGLDLCGNALTGVGSPGLSAGDAWQQGWATGADRVAGPPGVMTPTAGSLTGTLVQGGGNQLHFVNLDAVVARRVGSDGPGGWQVGPTTYAFAAYPGGAAVPPAGRGGVQLVQVASSGSATSLLRNTTYWTNTGSPANDLAAWTQLTADLGAAAGRRDAFSLLRNVGSARSGPITSAADPGMQLAVLVERLGGVYDAVLGLSAYQNMTLVLPGGTPLDRSAKDRDATGAPKLTLVLGALAAGQDPRYTYVALRRTHLGYWLQPALVTTGNADADQAPFALQQTLAQPSVPWPLTDDGSGPAYGAAFHDWSRALCSCDDARSKYLSAVPPSGWAALLATSAPPAAATYSPAVWTAVRDEIAQELVWVQNVHHMYVDALSFQAELTGTGAIGLLSAWNEVTDSLKHDAEFDAAAAHELHALLGIANILLLLGELLPKPISLPISFVVGAWFGALEYFLERGQAPDPALDVAVADAGDSFVAAVSANLANLGAEFSLLLSDYGRLRAAGQGLAAGAPGWRGGGSGAELRQLAKAAKAGFYRALVPVVYEQLRVGASNTGDPTTWSVQIGHNRAAPFERYLGTHSSWVAAVGQASGTDLAVLGKTPMLTEPLHPEPLTDQLAADIQAQGVWWPTVFRTWPFTVHRCTVVTAGTITGLWGENQCH